jgi:hypothetical protein
MWMLEEGRILINHDITTYHLSLRLEHALGLFAEQFKQQFAFRI